MCLLLTPHFPGPGQTKEPVQRTLETEGPVVATWLQRLGFHSNSAVTAAEGAQAPQGFAAPGAKVAGTGSEAAEFLNGTSDREEDIFL